MTGRVFLNYRRGDDAGTVGRLFDRLEQTLGRDAIFMDVEGHIKAGDDYVDVLRAQVAQCDVLLAVIGPRWLTITDETGRRRLDNPEDWVRVEIASALEAGAKKRVIPVLVPGGEMPRAEDLPEPLKPLARKQAVRITLERFNVDAQGLVSQIKGVLDDLAQQRVASDAERAAAEAAQRQREADEQARLAAVEARAREQRASGMSAEYVRKAEELANWEFIKARDDLDELRDHLARFPGGTTERYAQARLAELTFKTLSASSPTETLRAFIEAFPKSEHAATVQKWLATAEASAKSEAEAEERRAREIAAWAAIAAGTDKHAIRDFLKDWPDGLHAADAQVRLKELSGAGRFNRRAILKGVGYGVAGTAALGGAGIATFVPGMPVWRAINDRSIRTFGHEDFIASVAFAPNGETVLSGADKKLKLWDVKTGKKLRTFAGHSGLVYAVAFSPTGKTALSGSHELKLWDVASGKELRTFKGTVFSVAFSLDGRFALAGQKLWDVAAGKLLRTFGNPDSFVISVALSSDGKTALSAYTDRSFTLWEVATGKERRTIKVPDRPGMGLLLRAGCVALSPDGKTVLSGVDTSLQLWDATTGQELRTFTKQGYSISSVAFAPDGKSALSAGWGKGLHLWDVATGKEIRALTGHSSFVSCATFAPDGKTAVSGSYDKTLKLWDLTN